MPEGQAEIIVCSDNFHGRTIGIVGFSTDPDARGGFGPFAPGFRVVPFGDAEAFEAAITPNTVGFPGRADPGRGGRDDSAGWLFPRVRDLCTANNVTLILDEIQTGLGRTGKLLAEEHEGIVADVTLIGKALSGGFYPVSAVLSNSEVLGVLKPGQHGSTFGGNPLACAVARAALKVLTEEGMIENSAVSGRVLQGAASGYPQQYGAGGARTRADAGGRASPGGGRSRPACEALRARGVLAKDTHGHTIRIAPPLVITRDEVDWALEQIEPVLTGAA